MFSVLLRLSLSLEEPFKAIPIDFIPYIDEWSVLNTLTVNTNLKFVPRPIYQGNPRQSWILDRGFQIPDSWFQSLWVELGFWIPVVCGIPDSLSCLPDPKAQDSRFHKQNFPGFGNPDSLTWGDIPLNKTITAGHSSQSPINRNLYEKYLCVNTSLAV